MGLGQGIGKSKLAMNLPMSGYMNYLDVVNYVVNVWGSLRVCKCSYLMKMLLWWWEEAEGDREGAATLWMQMSTFSLNLDIYTCALGP